MRSCLFRPHVMSRDHDKTMTMTYQGLLGLETSYLLRIAAIMETEILQHRHL